MRTRASFERGGRGYSLIDFDRRRVGAYRIDCWTFVARDDLYTASVYTEVRRGRGKDSFTTISNHAESVLAEYKTTDHEKAIGLFLSSDYANTAGGKM